MKTIIKSLFFLLIITSCKKKENNLTYTINYSIYSESTPYCIFYMDDTNGCIHYYQSFSKSWSKKVTVTNKNYYSLELKNCNKQLRTDSIQMHISSDGYVSKSYTGYYSDSCFYKKLTITIK